MFFAQLSRTHSRDAKHQSVQCVKEIRHDVKAKRLRVSYTVDVNVDPCNFDKANFETKAEEGFHILDQVGSGRTSKGFLAVSSDGHECLLKMYVRKFDEVENYRAIPTNKEVQMYSQIYNKSVSVVTLYRHLCLVLPYARPVREEEREYALDELKKLLKGKFRVKVKTLRKKKKKTTCYCKFKETDQVWRHCGFIAEKGKESFFVFELEDLEECVNEADHDMYIENHLQRVRDSGPTAGRSLVHS